MCGCVYVWWGVHMCVCEGACVYIGMGCTHQKGTYMYCIQTLHSPNTDAFIPSLWLCNPAHI